MHAANKGLLHFSNPRSQILEPRSIAFRTAPKKPLFMQYMMRSLFILFVSFLLPAIGAFGSQGRQLQTNVVFINEIHYANQGDDVAEFVEIAHPTDVDISNYMIVLYRGKSGSKYKSISLATATSSGDSNGLSFSYIDILGIRNGNNQGDGIALIDPSGLVVQFLSYETDSFVAINGPAAGMASTDIGVSEPWWTPVGHSLQLGGTGCYYGEFSWQATALVDTRGNINTGQSVSCPTNEIFILEFLGWPSNPSILPLGICEGDCNKDAHCELGLACFGRNKGDPAPPGCFGRPSGGKDYCHVPEEGILVKVANIAPKDASLGLCQGHCRAHSECLPGLSCFFRRGTEDVPGCSSNNAVQGIWGTNYCYRAASAIGTPTASPTTNPSTVAQTTSPSMMPHVSPTLSPSFAVMLTSNPSSPKPVSEITTPEPTTMSISTASPESTAAPTLYTTSGPSPTGPPTIAPTLFSTTTESPTQTPTFPSPSPTLLTATGLPTSIPILTSSPTTVMPTQTLVGPPTGAPTQFSSTSTPNPTLNLSPEAEPIMVTAGPTATKALPPTLTPTTSVSPTTVVGPPPLTAMPTIAKSSANQIPIPSPTPSPSLPPTLNPTSSPPISTPMPSRTEIPTQHPSTYPTDASNSPTSTPTTAPTRGQTPLPSMSPQALQGVVEPTLGYPKPLKTKTCTSETPCARCEGDCANDDAKCRPDLGLVCYSRNGNQPVVGCVNGGPGDVSGAHYCYEPPTDGPVTYVPGDLTVYENGLVLSTGLTSRIIAEQYKRVNFDVSGGGSSDDIFHVDPDGAAIFEDPSSGGFRYVSNAESGSRGTVGAIVFNADAEVVGYENLLADSITRRNCGGGKTFFNTWLSCEETDGGQVWEVDPFGIMPPRKTLIGGLTGDWFESAAYDNRDPINVKFFITADREAGPVYRFSPDELAVAYANASGNYTDLLHTNVTGTATVEYLVLEPETFNPDNGKFWWTDNLTIAEESASIYYKKPEGIDIRDGICYFTCKGNKKLFILDLDAGVYESSSTDSGAFDRKPDQVARLLNGDNSILYFCEDSKTGSNGIHGRDTLGNYYTILENTGNNFTGETSGLAFSPDNRHMYLSYQKPGYIFDVTRSDGYPFDGQRLDIKYHNPDAIYHSE